MSPTLSDPQTRGDLFGDRQFVVIVSEKQARVVALPSQSCTYRQQLTETDFVVKAEVISLRGKENWVRIQVMQFVFIFQIVFACCVIFQTAIL